MAETSIAPDDQPELGLSLAAALAGLRVIAFHRRVDSFYGANLAHWPAEILESLRLARESWETTAGAVLASAVRYASVFHGGSWWCVVEVHYATVRSEVTVERAGAG